MNERAGTTAAETDLPRWDLSDLFPGPESPELKAALSDAAEDAKAFAAAHQGRLAGLDGASLGAAEAVSGALDAPGVQEAADSCTKCERSRYGKPVACTTSNSPRPYSACISASIGCSANGPSSGNAAAGTCASGPRALTN